MAAPISSLERVRAALAEAGLGLELCEFPASTRSAAEAAAAIGCELAQIAKSLVFRDRDADRPVLVVASGVNRVDEKRLAAHLGTRIGRADADFVRRRTGFAIGGVAPLGHLEPPRIVIDADLMALEAVWAAAGTPNAVFRLTPAELAAVTGGEVAEIKAAPHL